MSQNDEIKVTDAETLEWMSQLTESEKIELKRFALQQNATKLLQPKPGAPDFSSMSDQELERYKMKHGYYNR